MNAIKIKDLWGKKVNNIYPIKVPENSLPYKIEYWNVEGNIFLRKGDSTENGVWKFTRNGREANHLYLEKQRKEYIGWHKRKQKEIINLINNEDSL